MQIFLGLLLLFASWQSLATVVKYSDLVEKNISFQVFLNDLEVGTHEFRILRKNRQIEVDSSLNLEFKAMGLFKVKYAHKANEIWRDGCLQSLVSETKKRGKKINVEAQQSDLGMVVKGAKLTQTLNGCVRTFAYWNPQFLNEDYLLNVENGEYVPVNVTTTALENRAGSQVSIDGSKVDIQLAYDSAGQWLSLQSELKMGGVLRYVRVQ
jgi:hypothetical protein